MKGLGPLLLALLALPATAFAAPDDQADEPHAPLPAPAARKPAPTPRKPAPTPPAAPAKVFRFDALRIEGLAGPNALVLRTLDHGRRRSLLRYRRSFLRRILTTLEAPTR